MPRVADYPSQDKQANLPAERIGGRYITQYNPDIALKIVERMAEGETIAKICEKGSGFPHPTTFKRWVVNNPELAKAVDAARKLSAQSMEEEALDAAREIKRSQRDGTHVRAVEILLQQLRWSMERRDPAQYGTKAPVNIRVPIQVNTTLALSEDAGSIIDGKSIYKIEARQNVSPDRTIEQAKSTEYVVPLVKGKPIAKRQAKNDEGPDTA